MKFNWRQVIFVGLGLLIGYFDRQNRDKLSASLIMLFLDYLVIETGISIFQGYGLGSGGRRVSPNKSNSISRFNLKLRWFGLLLMAGLMTLYWVESRR